MGGFTPLPTQFDPNNPTPYGSGPVWSTYYPWANTDPNAPMEQVFGQNRNIISAGANQLNQEAGAQLSYYGALQVPFQEAQNQALNNLAQTPGFTDQEAADIRGNPNAPVQSLTQNQQDIMQGLDQSQQGTGAMLNQYQADVGGLANDLPNRYQSQVGQLKAGLDQAQTKFSGLDTAVNNPALGFDPNQTEKQLTDQDVQDLQTQAMTSVGNQFRTNEDLLERQAAAQGNTSPAQLAALRQAMVTQEGATAGDAATNARIAALQAQYGRAAGIEAQREGATQTQAGLQATAATTKEAAAQAAAGQAGQAALSAEEQAAQQQLNAEQAYGQFSTNTANTLAQQRLQAGEMNTAEQLQAQQTAEAQASGRAATIGAQRIAGQGAYRSGLAQQQGMAQQGGQTAQQLQLGTYGTMTSGLNSAASGQGSFEVGKPSAGDTAAKDFIKAGASLFEHGGVATEPTIAKIGEHGPEAVIPLGRYKSMRQRDPEFAKAA